MTTVLILLLILFPAQIYAQAQGGYGDCIAGQGDNVLYDPTDPFEMDPPCVDCDINTYNDGTGNNGAGNSTCIAINTATQYPIDAAGNYTNQQAAVGYRDCAVTGQVTDSNVTPTTCVAASASASCNVGYYNSTGGICVAWTNCPVGKYNNRVATTTQNSDCQPCITDTFMTNTTAANETSTCTDVDTHYFAADINDANTNSGAVQQLLCPDGTYRFDDDIGACIPCPIGSIMSDYSSRTCSGFGPTFYGVDINGNYTASGGAVSTRPCYSSGTIFQCQECTGPLDSDCLKAECGVGYGTTSGGKFCEQCDYPQFNIALSELPCSLTKCPLGQGLKNSDDLGWTFDPAKDEAYNCKLCPPNFFSASANHSQCVAVSAGHFAALASSAYTTSGAVQQLKCPAGTASADGNGNCALPWSSCDAGTFVSTAATISNVQQCSACTDGSFSVGTPALDTNTTNSCQDVDAGYFGAYSSGGHAPQNAVQQLPCVQGSYSTDGTGVCSSPVLGYLTVNSTFHHVSTAATASVQCPVGSWDDGLTFPSAGSTNCAQTWSGCPIGERLSSVATNIADNQCTACGDGKFNDEAVASVDANAATTCKKVDNGHFAAFASGANTISGGVQQLKCPAGTASSDGNGYCPLPWQPCLAGTFVSTAATISNVQQCSACTDGSFSVDTPALDTNTTNSCQDVDAGYFGASSGGGHAPTNAVQQLPCVQGSYSTDGTGLCSPPVLGYLTVNSNFQHVLTAATASVQCPVGSWDDGSTFPSAGSTNCAQTWSGCPIGTYISHSTNNQIATSVRDNTCTNCVFGKFNDVAVASVNANGATNCKKVDNGHFAADANGTWVAIVAVQQVACPSGTYNQLGDGQCQPVPAGFFAVNAANTYTNRAATWAMNCAPGTFNIVDHTTRVSGECKYCAAGTEFQTSATACTNCHVGKFQGSSSVASVTCDSCAGTKETRYVGVYRATGASECVACGDGESSFGWQCIALVCHCDNGPAAVGTACPDNGAYMCADLSCLHPDVTVHVLKRSTVFNVKVGELQPGDLVIGEDGTSAVQRVERFPVSDNGCIVPHDLCKEQLRTKIVLSRNHAVRCPEWPLDNWMFCQDEWERESVHEYVHVELENYMSDHLLSDAVVLESWDGYRRGNVDSGDTCTVGCPWPHEWKKSILDSRKRIRVDMRKSTNLDMRRMHSTRSDTRKVRDGRKVSERGMKILRSYLTK